MARVLALHRGSSEAVRSSAARLDAPRWSLGRFAVVSFEIIVGTCVIRLLPGDRGSGVACAER
jgi:hypothetical protein